MPKTTVYIYAESDGQSPVVDWLTDLRRNNLKAFTACRARVMLLSALGHELRRPHADMLEHGIYELRARAGHVNYRLLYFFHGKDIAVLAHALTKEAHVPTQDIERAIERRKQYEQAPARHRTAFDL